MLSHVLVDVLEKIAVIGLKFGQDSNLENLSNLIYSLILDNCDINPKLKVV